MVLLSDECAMSILIYCLYEEGIKKFGHKKRWHSMNLHFAATEMNKSTNSMAFFTTGTLRDLLKICRVKNNSQKNPIHSNTEFCF